MIFSQPPFSEFITQLTIQWRENAVITGSDTFKKLEDSRIEELDLSTIKGSSMDASWVEDEAGNVMVAKRNGHFRSEMGWHKTSPREKVAADLAPPNTPIAPVLIWERPLPGVRPLSAQAYICKVF